MVELHGVGTELLSSSEGRGVAGGYGCDGGALRWLSVVLQIGRGREPGRAEGGIAVGDDSVASLEGSGRKQEVAREAGGGARARARRHASAYWQRLKTVGSWAGPAQVGCTVLGCGWLLGKVQVISVLYFSVLFCFYLILLPLF